MELFLIYRKTDNGKWYIIEYKNFEIDAKNALDRIQYLDKQKWLTNSMIARIQNFPNDVYVPVFNYQIRKVHSGH